MHDGCCMFKFCRRLVRPYFNVLLVCAIDHASSTTHEKSLVPTPWFQVHHPEACDTASTALQHTRTVPGTKNLKVSFSFIFIFYISKSKKWTEGFSLYCGTSFQATRFSRYRYTMYIPYLKIPGQLRPLHDVISRRIKTPNALPRHSQYSYTVLFQRSEPLKIIK